MALQLAPVSAAFLLHQLSSLPVFIHVCYMLYFSRVIYRLDAIVLCLLTSIFVYII